MVADAGEDVEHLALFGVRIADAVGGDERKMERAREFDGSLVAGFFGAIVVALKFDKNIVGTEDTESCSSMRARLPRRRRCASACAKRTVFAASEADESVGILCEFFRTGEGTAVLRHAEFHLRDEAAEVLVAGAGGDEERNLCVPIDEPEIRQSISLPMCALTLSFFAARWKRAAP